MRAPRILAVDIGAGHVACGVFTAGPSGRLVLQQFALEPHTSDPAHESRATIEIAQALGAVAARHRLSGTSAIAVPAHLALTKFIKTPSVAKEKRRKMVEFEAAENIPHPLTEVVWDYAVVSDDGFDLEVMLAAMKFETIQALCGAADTAGFPAERATPAGLALRNAFWYTHPEVKESVIVVNIGARSTHLLFLEGERFFLRALPVAGNSVTLGIVDELRIDFASAEALKIQVLSGLSDLPVGSPSRLAVQRAAATFSARLQLEITRSLVNHRRQTGAGAPVGVYITGGGSLIPELPPALAEKLKVPVHRFDPLKRVDVAGDARAAGAESAGAVMSDLIGLATSLVPGAKSASEASLLPPSIIEELAMRKRQPLFVVAAALVVAALLPPIYYLHREVQGKKEYVLAIDGEAMPLRSRQTRNEDNLRQIEEARKRIAALRPAYDTKANWVNFFTDLQQQLGKVENVWLDELHVLRPPPPAPVPFADQQPPPPADPNAPVDPNAPAAVPTTPPPPPVRVTLSGRLLDVANPQAKVSAESFERVKQLLQQFKQSPFVAAVENERFDNNQNGLLRFDVTVVINPKKPL